MLSKVYEVRQTATLPVTCNPTWRPKVMCCYKSFVFCTNWPINQLEKCYLEGKICLFEIFELGLFILIVKKFLLCTRAN